MGDIEPNPKIYQSVPKLFNSFGVKVYMWKSTRATSTSSTL